MNCILSQIAASTESQLAWKLGPWEPATVDGKGKAPPSVWRMWLMALGFYEATRVVMPSLHSETSNKSRHREPSVFAGKR
jgi:hypothetical protein